MGLLRNETKNGSQGFKLSEVNCSRFIASYNFDVTKSGRRHANGNERTVV
jgi:hypothetical protein